MTVTSNDRFALCNTRAAGFSPRGRPRKLKHAAQWTTGGMAKRSAAMSLELDMPAPAFVGLGHATLEITELIN